MNKVFVCLAGLATVLSQPPVALADPPSWSLPHQPVASAGSLYANPLVPPSAAASAPIESTVDRLTVPPDAADAPVGTTDGKMATLPPPPNVAVPLLPEASTAPALPISPSPFPYESPSEFPSASTPSPQSIPEAPTSQYGTPIPTDLGVQFDLSNSADPLPQAVAPQVAPSPWTQPFQAPTLPPPDRPSPVPAKPTQQPPAAKNSEFTLTDLFEGGSDSVVAIAVGNAEGTRSPNGKPNQAFYGHSDPGNGVWNLGTFSYQHGANSPEEADGKQLQRLKKQSQVMQDQATAMGIKLTLEETLNGIDLANQAPKAVLDREGYVAWLAKAHAMGLNGQDAILWARVQSFIDPNTQQWNAPGLGNTADSITHDQQRRMQAIAKAIDAQNYQIATDARLRPQPIGFQLPNWNFAGRVFHRLALLFN